MIDENPLSFSLGEYCTALVGDNVASYRRRSKHVTYANTAD